MKKILAILFSLMVICSHGQEPPAYTFQSTSTYQQMISEPVTVYEVGAESPYYSAGPRKVISPDGPKPGYDPSDPYKPDVPIGDPVLPILSFLLLYSGYIFLKKPGVKR